ncbi:YaaW family protein, partial [Vibrio parahaemolyticus]
EYREIVEDVAKKLKVNFNNGNDIEALENKIFEKILETALEKMSDEEKAALGEELGMKHGAAGKGGFTTSAFIYLFKAGGFKSYQITLIIANYIAKLILGHGLRLGTNAAIARTASILTGPIGWAITGIWTAVDLAGPSYKTTIPCVIHVAMLRKKYNSLQCTNDECGAVLTDTTTKFCPECGTKVA